MNHNNGRTERASARDLLQLRLVNLHQRSDAGGSSRQADTFALIAGS